MTWVASGKEYGITSPQQLDHSGIGKRTATQVAYIVRYIGRPRQEPLLGHVVAARREHAVVATGKPTLGLNLRVGFRT
jgi:hypothetical protein